MDVSPRRLVDPKIPEASKHVYTPACYVGTRCSGVQLSGLQPASILGNSSYVGNIERVLGSESTSTAFPSYICLLVPDLLSHVDNVTVTALPRQCLQFVNLSSHPKNNLACDVLEDIFKKQSFS